MDPAQLTVVGLFSHLSEVKGQAPAVFASKKFTEGHSIRQWVRSPERYTQTPQHA